jgi:hypothetical protein
MPTTARVARITGQSLGSDNVVFRFIVPPRYYAVGMKQKVRIL